MRLFRREGAGSRQETGIHGAPIVWQVANGHLQFFGLGCGGWGEVSMEVGDWGSSKP